MKLPHMHFLTNPDPLGQWLPQVTHNLVCIDCINLCSLQPNFVAIVLLIRSYKCKREVISIYLIYGSAQQVKAQVPVLYGHCGCSVAGDCNDIFGHPKWTPWSSFSHPYPSPSSSATVVWRAVPGYRECCCYNMELHAT